MKLKPLANNMTELELDGAVILFSYLKTPLWSWTLTNELGGSFSNKGVV